MVFENLLTRIIKDSKENWIIINFSTDARWVICEIILSDDSSRPLNSLSPRNQNYTVDI